MIDTLFLILNDSQHNLKYGNIQKTANKIENYFRQAFPRLEKKKLYSKQSKKDYLILRRA
ncbi:MAG: hypothetical protein LBT10_00985 [Methanobrevibacter sp.]|nr:hypothetical protein [Methanobrevibacter sp.]